MLVKLIKRRLEFVTIYVNKSNVSWNKVIWIYEAKFELFYISKRKFEWRAPGTVLNHENYRNVEMLQL